MNLAAKQIKHILLATAFAVATVPHTVLAADDEIGTTGRAGDFTLSFRAGNLFSSARSEGISNIGPVGFTPEGTIPGTDINVDDSLLVTFIPSYFLTNHFAIDAFIATPAFMGITAEGLEGFGVTDIGKIEYIVPSVYLTAYPAPANWKLQPSLSMGFGTMIKTRDDRASEQVENALGAGTTLDVARDSFIPTARAGIDYKISDRWSVGVHATMFWGKTRATITPTAVIPLGPGLSAPLGDVTADVKIDALALQGAFTYRF